MRTAFLVLAATAAIAGSAAPAAETAGQVPTCAPPRLGVGYQHTLGAALASGRDLWGEQMLRAPGGPTLAATAHALPPLLYAAGHGGEQLTRSGVYYLPFTLPVSVGGPRGFGLHVADGSEIIVRRIDGPRLDVNVGGSGTEPFGSCLARLQTASLAEGYLPILEVDYADGAGVHYREESFVGRLPRARSLVSFLRISADALSARRSARVVLTTSRGSRETIVVPRGKTVEVDAAFIHADARLQHVDGDVYSAARTTVAAFWARGVASAAQFVVPEPEVDRAERALLVQELEMTWRYSVGNTYEELSYAEALDVAQTMAAFGYGDVSRQILRYTLRRLPARFTYWRAGERLVAGAQYFRLTGDDRYVREELPVLRRVVDRLSRSVGPNNLLPRERYSSDIPDQIISLQGQTLVWQGLLAMSRVWSDTGQAPLAREARTTAVRLERGLRRAVRSSERRLPDGSLFVPAELLDSGAPFMCLPESREGTYWNLVAPYALASGFFAPHSAEANGLLRYLVRHGSRLVGLVRAGAYRLGTKGSGTDQVYGINVARFLADNDQADQLVLSLYGTLGAAMTPGTYVSGEAASVSPLHGAYYRSMYLPPNNTTSATFLETLRLMLVHETRGAHGVPLGLELAFATPRSWLVDGRMIAVHDAPTSFGPLSYSITRAGDRIAVDVDVPASRDLRSLRLRLRLPGETKTLDLSGRHGEVRLTVRS